LAGEPEQVEQGLEAKAKAEFKLSMEAAGRSDVKKSARLNAGGGEVEAEEGAIDPEEDRRALSSSGKLCAESLLPKVSSCGLTSRPSLTAAPASPRLVVKTFKHTLRGGISYLFLV
jgi:hypothetical protein